MKQKQPYKNPLTTFVIWLIFFSIVIFGGIKDNEFLIGLGVGACQILLIVQSNELKSKNWKLAGILISVVLPIAGLLWPDNITVVYVINMVVYYSMWKFGKDDDGPSPFRKLFPKALPALVPVANR